MHTWVKSEIVDNAYFGSISILLELTERQGLWEFPIYSDQEGKT